MNKNTILKYTTNYEDGLIDDLKDPKEAQNYLEASFLAYEEDGNTDALLLALEHVAKAQGGINKMEKLGFRIRLERQATISEHLKTRDKVPA